MFVAAPRLLSLLLLSSLRRQRQPSILWVGGGDETDAEVEALVSRRAAARAQRDWEAADALKVDLDRRGVALRDRPGGGTDWEWKIGDEEAVSYSDPSVLALAHSAFAAGSDPGSLGKQAFRQLMNTGAPTAPPLHGRMAADAAFLFSVAGVKAPEELYDRLASDMEKELLRFGTRKSCRFQDILCICERLSAAGVPPTHTVFSSATSLVSARGEEDLVHLGVQSKAWGKASPFATRPLVQLFRHGARHNRIDSRGLSSACPPEMAATMFTNNKRPLVVDIGCGFGTSIHALGALAQEGDCHPFINSCNFLGIDLNEQALKYAKSMALRNGHTGRVEYVQADCLEFLRKSLPAYAGEIRLISIQFPTPFRAEYWLQGSAQDNAASAKAGRLPEAKDFLVSADLLCACRDVLSDDGLMLFQTNAMDVAHYLRELIGKHLTEFEEIPDVVKAVEEAGNHDIPRRQRRFVEQVGAVDLPYTIGKTFLQCVPPPLLVFVTSFIIPPLA